MNKKNINRKSKIICFLVLGMLIAFAGNAYSFAPPGAGASQRGLINNIKDTEIFKKSSITKTIKTNKRKLQKEPKSFLSTLIKNQPGVDFELTRSEINQDVSVYHFQQTYKELPVFGGETLVRISEKEGTIILTGYLFIDIKTPVEPVYQIPTLQNIIKKLLNGGKPEGIPQLGILPADDGHHLCYKIRMIKDIAGDYIFYMDALTGNVLRAFNRVDAVSSKQ